MASSVIQATGRTESEDGSKLGIQSEVRNVLQNVYTILEVEVNMVENSVNLIFTDKKR